MKWRKHTTDTQQENFNNIDARVMKMKEKFKLKEEDAGRRIIWEKNILEAVSLWTELEQPLLPEVLAVPENTEKDAEVTIKTLWTDLKEKVANHIKKGKKKVETPIPSTTGTREKIDTSRIFELPEDGYGVQVHRITLQQLSKSCPSSYTEYDTKRYELSEIFRPSDENHTNPLSEDCKPKTIRYFHFPANNMHVCTSFPPSKSKIWDSRSPTLAIFCANLNVVD